mmetsp:Transcript_15890/g.41206  ORF Transcript_15890/g.41206 Transcript_15890/m.41206 type:complete len:214 (-) Transcript_15890:10-651(-)
MPLPCRFLNLLFPALLLSCAWRVGVGMIWSGGRRHRRGPGLQALTGRPRSPRRFGHCRMGRSQPRGLRRRELSRWWSSRARLPSLRRSLRSRDGLRRRRLGLSARGAFLWWWRSRLRADRLRLRLLRLPCRLLRLLLCSFSLSCLPFFGERERERRRGERLRALCLGLRDRFCFGLALLLPGDLSDRRPDASLPLPRPCFWSFSFSFSLASFP